MKLSQRTEYEIVGKVIQEARDELGITQRALARKVGRTETSISKIEAGNQRVDLVELLDIAIALRVPLKELAARFEEQATRLTSHKDNSD